MKPSLLLKSWKSWLIAANLLVASFPPSAWSYDQHFTVSGNLPGVLGAHRVKCQHSVATWVRTPMCANPGPNGCGYYDIQADPLPDIITPDQTIAFNVRTIPYYGFAARWTERTFTLGGYITPDVNPFVIQTDACAEVAEETFTLTQDEAWFQATEGVGGAITISYVGASLPVADWDWPAHEVCDAASTTYACQTVLPTAESKLKALMLSGRVPGKVLEVRGWSGRIPGSSLYLNSILFKVDPKKFFQGSLPVSWFRDGDALVKAGANQAPYDLAVGETFVASAAEEVPLYLGDGQYIPDDVEGKVFPETNGIKVRTYWARGSKIYKVSDLKAMSLEKLQTLPLPWMGQSLNQDDYAAWPKKDNPLQAIPEGTDWPPIPPDQVQNLNPVILSECPDMYQYYALFRQCADDFLKPGTQVDVNNFVNYLDQLKHDLRETDNAIDYTTYRADGSIDTHAENEPGVDKHYDIDDLRRLNPRNVNLKDPFQATSFWLKFRVKVYCWYGFCSDKGYQPWWDDGGYKFNPNYWFERWENRNYDVTQAANDYKSEMGTLFNELSIQRNLLELPAFSWAWGKRCVTQTTIGPGGATGTVTNCVDGYGVNSGKSGSPDFGKISYGNLEIISLIDKNSYDVYVNNIDKNSFAWQVYIGNPNAAGEPFQNVRSFVMEGERVPMELEHEKFWTDIIDSKYRHYVVQEYPIVFQDASGVRFPLGKIKIRRLIHQDFGGAVWSEWTDDMSHWGWIGNNFTGLNDVVDNDAPGINPDDADTYDKQSAEYLTDKYNLNERDEMTWSEKEEALLKIAKYIAVSEGLDLLVKAAYKYRKEAWYLAHKMGLAYTIRKTYTYARALYRVYSEYRTTMDQMREVRDASRRLKRNYRLLRATYNDIWNYYGHELDYSSLRPTNITKLLPIHLLGRADYAMFSTVTSLTDMAKGSHLLTLKFETYCSKAFGAAPQIRFHRNEQQEIAQILDQNSSDQTEQQMQAFKNMKASNPNLNSPEQAWKLSRLTEMLTKQVSGSGLWLENGYTRAAYNTLSYAESDANSWVALKDRSQWQINSFASIFVNQQTGAVKTNLADMVNRSAYVTRTPVAFRNIAFDPIEAELRGASNGVLTCGGAACFAK